MTENEFVAELKNHSQRAYGKLLDDFEQKVFATCMSFVPNKEDAEDIAQEVFVEVFNSIGKFKGNSKLSTWIYKIATNKCLEFIRKKSSKKRFGFVQLLLGNTIPLDRSTYFTNMNHPGILLENKEKSETLFKAINQLPEAQKVVFTLCKVDGKSYEDISEITEKSLASVESLMFREKKNLQNLLQDFYKNEK